jgi:hypothetical protein
MISAKDFVGRVYGGFLSTTEHPTTLAKLVSGIRKLANRTKSGEVIVQNVTITEEIKPKSVVVKRITFEIVEKDPQWSKPTSNE